MKTNFKFYSKALLLTVLMGSLFLTSCKKDEDAILPPSIEMSMENQDISMRFEEALTIKAKSLMNIAYDEEWTLDGNVVSTTDSYSFQAPSSGSYTITYRAYNSSGEYTKEYNVTVSSKQIPATDGSNMYVTTLFEYLPAPGQFINKAPGNHASARGILGGRGMVTLGAWGGSIVLGFDHTVINQTDKKDIIIYGNPNQSFAEPGIVWVMEYENGNGKPDDTWYEIAGSEFGKEGYIRNYSVTYTRPKPATEEVAWKDNQGNTGVVATNIYHKQAYFPEWVEGDTYSLTGSILPSTNIDMSNPSYITSAPFEYGYADNKVGGDEIDIADAVDKDGKKVNLKGVDFIKIQTGIQANMGWLGELSTEVLGVADISLIKK